MKKKTYVIGDVHGAYRALIQVLKKANFDYEKDELISLGDVADGYGKEVPKCFDELLKVKNFIFIIGNHDVWLRDYLNYGAMPNIWLSQGGKGTLKAYSEVNTLDMLERHKKFLNNAKKYHVDTHNNLYVHGGFNWREPIEDQKEYDLIWDRHLFTSACYWQNQFDLGRSKLITTRNYNEVFIGHTTTSMYDTSLLPVHVSNIWNLDQGAGWEGKLTLMNVETHEFYQSDIVQELYPDINNKR